MDMWDWLIDCYNEGSLTLYELEEVLSDNDAAISLWDEWSRDVDEGNAQIAFVRNQIRPFISHIKKRS